MAKEISDPLRQKIADIIELRGMSLRDISLALGRNHAFLHQFLYRQSPRNMRLSEIERLSEILDVPVGELQSEGQRKKSSAIFRQMRPMPMPSDLPIVGYARGGSDVMTINQENPIGYTSRPPQVASVEDAYAVEIVGDSMAPRLNPGEVAVVNPHRAIAAGSVVVVQFNDDSAQVGTFVERDSESIKIEKLNPPEILTFAPAEVRSIHKIVTIELSR